jgi:hypothetical protein
MEWQLPIKDGVSPSPGFRSRDPEDWIQEPGNEMVVKNVVKNVVKMS